MDVTSVWIAMSLSLTVLKATDAFLPHLEIEKRLFQFGKTASSSTLHSSLHVPKSRFLHFYVFASVLDSYGLLVSETLVVRIANGVHLIHVSRRVYECLFVHRFGKDAKIHTLHYLLGLTFYPLCFLSLNQSVDLKLESLLDVFWLAVGLFLVGIGSIHQHRAFLILRDSRSCAGGYGVPMGDWFAFSSCPHYLSEILIYLGFCFLTLWKSPAVQQACLFVLINQGIAAQMSHAWYRVTFKAYPTERSALFSLSTFLRWFTATWQAC